MTARYAIYFAPPADAPLAQFGAAWLGRDVETGDAPPRPEASPFSAERLDDITASPRHYGFHATLAPPFALAPGCTREELDAAIEAFAARRGRFEAPPLRLADIGGGFLALVLSDHNDAMQTLAADLVVACHRFRAPQSEAELERRRAAGLTPRQEELLARWGYPYVMEEFGFHMTLSNKLEEEERRALAEVLEPLVAPVCRGPLAVDGIALFEQPDRDTPFRLARRYPFAG